MPNAPHATMVRTLLEVAADWMTAAPLRFINYFGPFRLNLEPVLGQDFMEFYSLNPRTDNVDVVLNLRASATLNSRNARESIRKAARHGYTVQVLQRQFLEVGHIDLIRRLVARRVFAQSDVSYMTNILSLMNHSTCTFFEARLGNKLVGFAAAHHFFGKFPILVYAITDREYAAVSDAIYPAAISHYSQLGAESMGLGYSVEAGLLQFKLKWGDCRLGLPFYQRTWMRRNSQERATDCLHWITRVILMKSLDLGTNNLGLRNPRDHEQADSQGG
jgi:hypothetical protein